MGRSQHWVGFELPQAGPLDQHKEESAAPNTGPPRQVKVMTFANYCPFTEMSLRNLPAPQSYTRQERYQVMPPITLDLVGFHQEKSLSIYQGVVYYLLWLHSRYHKVSVGEPGGQAGWLQRREQSGVVFWRGKPGCSWWWGREGLEAGVWKG